MIESLINIEEMQKKPAITFLWAMIVNSVAIIAASQVHSLPGVNFGFFAVLFTIIPSVYFITLLIKKEEVREEKKIEQGGLSFWEAHGKDIVIILFYFFGVTLSFALWSYMLAPEYFNIQIDKINDIRGTGAITQEGMLQSIFFNNIQVMIVAFLFSLIFGAGAIFILVWNASVLGVFIGQFSKSLWQIPLVSASFLPHGIPEIGGYVASALAGGILSAAILRRKQGIMSYVIIDSLKLLALAVFLIGISAVIEVYV